MSQVQVQYLAEWTDYAIYYASSPGRDAHFETEQAMRYHEVEAIDMRGRQGEPGEFNLDLSGVDLLKHRSKVGDFLDKDIIATQYEAEMRKLIKAHTGASRVEFFDHTVRASDPELRETKQVREPATLVHNDYTSKSGFVCLQENLGDEASALTKGRLQIINTWRPLVDPVENFPLAFCDLRSIEPGDMVDAERRAPNHIGEISLATYNPAHRWFYFADMRPDEVLLFKTFDSSNQGNTLCSIHTAIDLPDAPANAQPRESIESRAFVFYE